jgi:hypothetical protein
MSPAAWRHILLNGHYTFQSDGKMIDLDALVAGWSWVTEFSGVPAYNPCSGGFFMRALTAAGDSP